MGDTIVWDIHETPETSRRSYTGHSTFPKPSPKKQLFFQLADIAMGSGDL